MNYHQCEWCVRGAVWKFVTPSYIRYSCGIRAHFEKVKRQIYLDGYDSFNQILNLEKFPIEPEGAGE